MASRKLCVVLFLLALAPLWAQSAGYYMEIRFIQRLSWTSDEYAMRYEVIIQRQEGRQYTTAIREFTGNTFIEVSLHPGKYRFQVIPHDYLGEPIPVAEWMNFEVLPGVATELNNQLIPGDHEIIVVNPSGTTVNRAEVTLPKPGAEKTAEQITETEQAYEADKTLQYTRQFDLYATAAYVPLLPLYGENTLVGENISPFGMAVRLSAVFAQQRFINPGLELTASWRAYTNNAGKAAQSIAFDCNILAQSRFPGGRAALNLRAGAGVSLLPENQPASSNGQYSVHVNIGASFLWLFMRNFYLEGGVEYSQFFTEKYFGFIRPWIGLGYRF